MNLIVGLALLVFWVVKLSVAAAVVYGVIYLLTFL